jgi:hypothetical protein
MDGTARGGGEAVAAGAVAVAEAAAAAAFRGVWDSANGYQLLKQYCLCVSPASCSVCSTVNWYACHLGIECVSAGPSTARSPSY